MKEYFKSLISNTDPASAMRWIMIFVVIFTTVVFWVTWLIVCICKQEVSDMPSGAVTAYSTANGSAIAGKVVQKIFGENKDEKVG
jgi:predicted permease